MPIILSLNLLNFDVGIGIWQFNLVIQLILFVILYEENQNLNPLSQLLNYSKKKKKTYNQETKWVSLLHQLLSLPIINKELKIM